MGPLGWQETVFIFILALLIFGPKKLPDLGRSLGSSIREFKGGIGGGDNEDEDEKEQKRVEESAGKSA